MPRDRSGLPLRWLVPTPGAVPTSALEAASSGLPRTMSEPRSASMMVGALRLAFGSEGKTELSITLRPPMPRTFSSLSTTAMSSSPMRQEPQG